MSRYGQRSTGSAKLWMKCGPTGTHGSNKQPPCWPRRRSAGAGGYGEDDKAGHRRDVAAKLRLSVGFGTVLHQTDPIWAQVSSFFGGAEFSPKSVTASA